MHKLTQRTYIGRIEAGTLYVPRQQIDRDIMQCQDEPQVEITIRPERKGKTQEQLGAFHGPMLDQIQADYMAKDGVYKSTDRIKYELKEAFLTKEKKYWSDGSPVLLQIAHPEKKGVTMTWHMEQVPSLADLSMDEMRSFIDAILTYFLHERGLTIVIDPAESRRVKKQHRK